MSAATSLLVATRSPGKLRELRPLFASAGLTIFDLDEFGIEESEEEHHLERFSTFEENAIAKAQYFYEISGGIPTVADDSGLEVSALDGRPGVRSKRWSGRTDLTGLALDEANNLALVEALRGVDDRSARYVCVAAFVSVGDTLTTRGESTGRIELLPRGTGGFGYDPYFFSDELGCTFGEASLEAKQRVSHRGRAFRELLGAILASR